MGGQKGRQSVFKPPGLVLYVCFRERRWYAVAIEFTNVKTNPPRSGQTLKTVESVDLFGGGGGGSGGDGGPLGNARKRRAFGHAEFEPQTRFLNVNVVQHIGQCGFPQTCLFDHRYAGFNKVKILNVKGFDGVQRLNLLLDGVGTSFDGGGGSTKQIVVGGNAGCSGKTQGNVGTRVNVCGGGGQGQGSFDLPQLLQCDGFLFSSRTQRPPKGLAVGCGGGDGGWWCGGGLDGGGGGGSGGSDGSHCGIDGGRG